MIKIRVIRNIYDTTHIPASFTQKIEWVGCIPSQILDLFPLCDSQTQDPLGDQELENGKIRTSTRFEAFARGDWYRISDPRVHPAAVTEEDLLDQFSEQRCPQCDTIGPDSIRMGEICTRCEQENNFDNEMECEVVCFHCNTPFDLSELSKNGYCEVCENLVACAECPYRFEPHQLINGKCKNCHAGSQHHVKLDKLLNLED